MERSDSFHPIENSEPVCYPVLHIADQDVHDVGESLTHNTYTQENITQVVENLSNESVAYVFPKVLFDTRDEQLEVVHTYDSEALVTIMVLLILSVLTKWAFKEILKRISEHRYGSRLTLGLSLLQETTLLLIYGIIAGLILRYAIPTSTVQDYHLAAVVSEFGTCPETLYFKPGEDIHLITQNDGDSFRCEIVGKAFREDSGHFIRETLLFDPEIFFFFLLPPIIFYSGYIINKDNFFQNLGSALMYAFAGTIISCFIVGFMMYGYARWGLEAQDSALANATGNSVPVGFANSVVPSLLFGALISATDPVTVLAIFEHLHVDPRLYSLVFGESMMNDAVAIVLFRAIDEYDTLEIEEGGGASFGVGRILKGIGIFAGVFVSSLVLGCIMGLITALLLKFSTLRKYPLLETAVFLMLSYMTYPLAEFARGSGIVAILFCGITQSQYSYKNLSEESRKMTKIVLELLNYVAEISIFLLMGISLFNYSYHQWVPGFILFSFAAILVGRVVNVYGLSFILNFRSYLQGIVLTRHVKEHIPYRFQHLLAFAGLRGAIAFALAIRNTETTERQLIFTTTLCIVLVTVIVCGGLTVPVLQCLKIKIHVDEDSTDDEGSYNPHWLTNKWKKFNHDYLTPFFTNEGDTMRDCCIRFWTMCNRKSRNQTYTRLYEEPATEEQDDIIVRYQPPASGITEMLAVAEVDVHISQEERSVGDEKLSASFHSEASEEDQGISEPQ